MSVILEILVQVVLEFLFEAIASAFVEGGLKAADGVSSLSFAGDIVRGATYAVTGFLLGLLSYLVFPEHLLPTDVLRAISSVASTIGMGFAVCLISWAITGRDRNQPFWSTKKFMQGVMFGISYTWARRLVTQ